MPKNEFLYFKRVALYIRVSHDEQRLHGFSLQAQRECLEQFARDNKMEIVGEYIDEAKTARKKIYKRTQFNNMLEEVKQNKIDVILFIKLDRWFRNVADYYKIQEILDKNGVVWKSVLEDYDTTTANGRLNLNIKLSIAQDEADRTSERIKFVFDNKVKNGQAITGALPFGLKLDNKKVVIDEEKAPIIRDAFNYFELNQTKRGTYNYIREKYGVNWCDATFRNMLKNPLYIGAYRDNPNYCDALITREQFNHIQGILKSTVIKNYSKGFIYIFGGLIVCDTCAHKMHATSTNDGQYKYYHCAQYTARKLCTHKRRINEKKLEAYLLENIENEIDKYIVEYNIKAAAAPKRPAVNKSEIQRKLNRLKELYVNDLIDIDAYKKDYNNYMQLLEEKPIATKTPAVNIDGLKAFLNSGFRNIYKSLTQEEKRTLWRSIIKEIRLNDNNDIVSIIFC